eukprot:12405143-Karenia_brevis.AAC.1
MSSGKLWPLSNFSCNPIGADYYSHKWSMATCGKSSTNYYYDDYLLLSLSLGPKDMHLKIPTTSNNIHN